MMPTDCQILEMAAKAAGADYEIDQDTGDIEILSEIGGMSGAWNPLSDDGDALRLCARLRLSIEISDCQLYARRNGRLLWNACVLHDVDSEILAATRRAIVLAAAEIGRGM